MSTYHPNNYIYKKINEEWLECRITAIKNDHYYLYVLKTLRNLDMPAEHAQIHPSTVETMRKFKISAIRYSEDCLYMPGLLRGKLYEDYGRMERTLSFIDDHANSQDSGPTKEYSGTTNHSIASILSDFKSFITVNKPTISQEELDEFGKHITLTFNVLGYSYLLTKHEKKKYRKNDLDTQCNAYHLLRLLVYMHEVLIRNINDRSVAEICFEYYVYLVDFLYVNVDVYFK